MVMDGIRTDPEWKNGDYTTEPPQGVRFILDFLIIAGSAPIPMQKSMPTRDEADKWLDKYLHDRAAGIDVNDFLYQLNSSRNYDPSANLEKITVPVMWINSADDFINPPDLGIAEREVKRLKNGKFILIPASEQTHGHGTHTYAAIWKDHMAELLQQPAR
jgi:homoserine O-acetyltransferase/O-succinyltransferase